MLAYKVTKKYARGSEEQVAQFRKQADATYFINMLLARDAGLKENASYLLYDMGELVEEFTESSAGGDSQGGSQQQGSRQAFSPSPLQTSPRPTGMPPSSFQDMQDDEAKK